MYPAFFSGTNCLNPSLFNSSLRIALLALYLKYVKTFLFLLYKIVRILLAKIMTQLLENYMTVYLAALPSTPPSFQNSFNACLKARIVCVGGVNRNCEVLSKLSTWSYRSKLKVRLLPIPRQWFCRNFIEWLNCKSLIEYKGNEIAFKAGLPLHWFNLSFLHSAYPNPGTPSRHLLAEDTKKSTFERSNGMAPKLDMASTNTFALGCNLRTSFATSSTWFITPELVSQCTIATRLWKIKSPQ